jgi:GT2 family glycosyltransferase/glycosyltransferase involved in cell wall biosynthesis
MSTRVTVVVPVYADWSSLSRCIASLKKHVSSQHKVMFINDCGPEAMLMEQNILAAITSVAHFEYYKNSHNLGFVQTCNRAAQELDETDNDMLFLNSDTETTKGFLEEMTDVLALNDKHGAVCPRSSNATIASIPFRFVGPDRDRSTEYAYELYKNIKALLPRYGVIPVAVGFCILIRRTLIQNFGLFDEVFGLGYSEENDFCMRINKFGYSCVMAHQAFVYHLESRSFSNEKRRQLVEHNESILVTRYPYYKAIVDRYINHYIDPVDWFADAIGGNTKTKLLIDLYHVPLAFNGTSRNAVSFLSYISKHADQERYEIVILVQKSAAIYHGLASFGFRIIYPETLNKELFHIGYSPSQIFHYGNLKILNRNCLKIVVSDLDIIALRSDKLLAVNFALRSIFLDTLRFADRIIAISDASKEDALSYFATELSDEERHRFVTIHQGYPGKTFEHGNVDYGTDARTIPEAVLEKGQYVLIMGNDYPHKAVAETVESLHGSGHTIVVVGATKFKNSHLVHTLASGGISDSYMEQLIERSAIILFPSLYEGFGLPIAEAAFHDKPIILSDTTVAHEVAALYGKQLAVQFFANFSEIPQLLGTQLHESRPKKTTRSTIRTNDDYNREVWQLLTKLPHEKTDPLFLRRRWLYFNQLSEYTMIDEPLPTIKPHIKVMNVIKKRSPKMHAYLRNVYRTRFERH